MEKQNATDEAVLKCDVRARRGMALPDVKGHLIFWPTFLLGLALDLWTKRAVFAWLQTQRSAEILGKFLTFRLAMNEGAAFGIFYGAHALLIGVAVVALAIVVGIFLFGRVQQRLTQAALGLFAAGVAGNLWDRLFNQGRVRDFIDVVYWPGRHWHTFNVADAMLCVAVGLLMLATLFTGSSCRTRAPRQK
jgi:signal peptidase II